MTRAMIIAVILLAAVIMGYIFFFKSPLPQRQPVKQSIEEQAVKEVIRALENKTIPITEKIAEKKPEKEQKTTVKEKSAYAEPQGWWHSKGERPHFMFQTDENFRIYPGRPRLGIRDLDIPWLKKRIQGPLKPCWDYIIKQADDYVTAIDPNSHKYAERPKSWAWGGQYIAAAGLLTGQKKYVDWCIRWAKIMAAQNFVKPKGMKLWEHDTYVRTRTECLAYMYDWFYDEFTPQDRKTVLDGLVGHVKSLSKFPFVTAPSHTGGHDRSCTSSLALGIVSAWPDYKNQEILDLARKNLAGIYACESHIARDGGFYMGWGSYTPGYTNNEWYLAWTTATNDVLLDDWMGELAYWYIYGLRGDGLYPAMEDASSSLQVSPIRSFHMLYAEYFLKNGHARWFYETKGFSGDKDFKWFFKLLFWDPEVTPETPDDLPLSRAFRGCGNVIFRDRWDEYTTHFVFRSVPFDGGNHRDADQNSFVIHYRGELAIDSGFTFSTPANYKRATIAHNAITVYDPEKKIKGIPRDGGQIRYPRSMGSWKRTLDHIRSGGPAYIYGLSRYQDNGEYAYAAGDATKVYEPNAVKLCRRDVVYLRTTQWPHPVILVFDRIESTKPELEKRFLLHTVNEPEIEGTLVTAVHNQGKLYCRTVYPLDPNITSVGGPGKEHWIFGKNYIPKNGFKKQMDKIEVGSWRIEVMPSSPRTMDYFLHAFYVTDADDHSPAPEALAIESDRVIGVETCGWTVIFPKSDEDVTTLSYIVPQGTAGATTLLVSGLIPDMKVEVSSGQSKQQHNTGKGGCFSTPVSVQAGDRVQISP